MNSDEARDPARRALCLAAAGGWMTGLGAAARAGSFALDPAALAQVEEAVAAAVAAGRLPGAVVRVQREDSVWERAIGVRAQEPEPEPLDAQTVYDCASLTKVVATAPVLARLMQEGAVAPETRVRALLPAFTSGEAITVGQLLTHTSGLPAGLPLEPAWEGQDRGVELACTRVPTHPPGTFFRYSDVNFILLGEMARRLGGRSLDALAQEWIFGPLAMRDTGFRPLARHPLARIAPTEWDGARMLRGQVHDPTARRMGGVAGHAGLFSTTADLARYARMLLGGGELDGVRVLQPATVARMTAVATPTALAERRSLGWDIDSPFSRARGTRYPLGSFGHTGFTGCALWIDPYSRTFHVMLSNRVHPRARETIVALYEQVGTLAAQAAAGFDVDRVPGALPAR
jgi:CubicO group peptidase (beta-lactamase class C family)